MHRLWLVLVRTIAIKQGEPGFARRTAEGGCPHIEIVDVFFLQGGLGAPFYPGTGLRGIDWQGWFRGLGSGTGVCAGRNRLCYNFCRPMLRSGMRAGEPKESQKTMSSTKSQLRLVGACAALAALALAVSCRGFFVKPTLSSIAVGPAAPTIDTGTTDNTVQMFAVGTFNDGSTGSPAVTWSISPSDGSIATIASGGLVTSVAIGSATVTATAVQNPAITGTQTVTVNIANVTGLTLDNSSYTISAANNTANAIAFAQTASGKVDVSATASWTTGDSTIATVQGGTDPVVITGVALGTTTVTASYTSGGTTYTAQANVVVQ